MARRVVVIGQSGAGKTTIAAVLAERLGFEHIWLDKLAKHCSTEAEILPELSRMMDMIGDNNWVIDSRNHLFVLREIASKADTVIWLDYRLWRIMFHILIPEFPVKGLSGFKYIVYKLRRSFVQRRQIRRDISVQKIRILAPKADILIFTAPEQARKWLAEETGRQVEKSFLQSYRG